MHNIDFSAKDRKRIKELRFNHPDPRALRRLQILLLKMYGLKHARIVELSGLSRSTVHRVLETYRQRGLDAVLEFHEQGPHSALASHQTSLETEFRERPVRTVAEASARIEELTGIRRGPSQVRQFLRNALGLRWRKTRAIPVPPKKSVEEHVATQQEYLETQLEPRLQEARAGMRRVLFVDASHMVLGTYLCCLWSLVPQFIRSASGRQRYNILGAINPLTFEFFRVSNTTYINSASVCELLRQIALAGITTPITLVLDNARYQRCKLVENLAQELNIEWLFLPSYSPNLNLIERLWKFVKKTALNSRHHTNFDDFKSRIDDCLNSLNTTHRSALTSLLTLKFQTFENATVLAA
jgi:transposase